jgi:hypothetical protein
VLLRDLPEENKLRIPKQLSMSRLNSQCSEPSRANGHMEMNQIKNVLLMRYLLHKFVNNKKPEEQDWTCAELEIEPTKNLEMDVTTLKPN